MAVDVSFLEKAYFYFDKPVPYLLGDKTLHIKPIGLEDSEIFLASLGIFMIDKNSLPDAEIIQMSYLDFIIKVLFQGEEKDVNIQRFANILRLCLDISNPYIKYDENNKPHLLEVENKKVIYDIGAKQFEDIKKIIICQNIHDYDDSYINPEVKASMAEVDAYNNRDIEYPSLERRIAIISSHTGMTKKEQLEMTYRSHCILFEEVCGEVEFNSTRAIALYTGQGDKIGHWIFKKKKGKFDDYFMSTKQFNKSMGGTGDVSAKPVAL